MRSKIEDEGRWESWRGRQERQNVGWLSLALNLIIFNQGKTRVDGNDERILLSDEIEAQKNDFFLLAIINRG